MAQDNITGQSVQSIHSGQRRLTKFFSILELHNTEDEVYPDKNIEKVPKAPSKTTFGKNSTIVAASHFFKSVFSPTILVMPAAFESGGLFFAIFGHIFLVILIAYNIGRLVVCAEYLSLREKLHVQTYDQVAFVSFAKCSERTRGYAKLARTVVNVLVIITNIDALIVFIVFIARNTNAIVSFYFPNTGFHVRHYIFFQMVPIMLSNTIRQLKFLSPFSIIASIILYISCICTFHFYLVQNLPPVWERRLVGDYSILRFLAMGLFSQSGISISLTIKSSMKKPHHFLSIPGVYCVTLIVTTLIYVPFGFIGYLQYGEHTCPSIMLNLPENENKAVVVKALTILSVFMTIPIVFFVAFNVLWNNFVKYRVPEVNRISFEYFLRAILVLILYVVASTFPTLGPMIVLKGALLHSQLEVIYPPILEYVAFYPEKGNGKGYFRLIKAIAIASFGIFCCISGTVMGIWDLVTGGSELLE